MKKESKDEIVIYVAKDGKTTLEVNLKEDTVWLDTHQMAELFQRDRTVIVRHIRNIYKTGELSPDSTCAKIAQVAKDGKKRAMDFYNLDMLVFLSLGILECFNDLLRIVFCQPIFLP